MNDELNDMIPPDPDKKLSGKLELHLRGLMDQSSLKTFENQLPAEFLEDASEGLRQANDSQQLDAVLRQLNSHMHHQLSHKKPRKRSTSIWDLSWTYWAILIILLLTITGFLVIRLFLKA